MAKHAQPRVDGEGSCRAANHPVDQGARIVRMILAQTRVIERNPTPSKAGCLDGVLQHIQKGVGVMKTLSFGQNVGGRTRG